MVLRHRSSWSFARAGIAAAFASVVLAACGGGDGGTTGPLVPAKLTKTAGDNQQVTVGASHTLGVRVLTSDDTPVPGATVSWSASTGSITPAISTAGADGTTTVQWKIGPMAGQQTATATSGSATATFTVTAAAGPVTSATVTPTNISLGSDCATAQITLDARDQFNNPAQVDGFTFASSDQNVATVDGGGFVTGKNSGTATITITNGTITRTVTVMVGGAGGQSMNVGEVITASGTAAACFGLLGGTGGAEFAVIAYLRGQNTGASLPLAVVGRAVVTPVGPPNPSFVPGGSFVAPPTGPQLSRDIVFERRLRARERRELTPLVPMARARRADALAGRLSAEAIAPGKPRFAIGDVKMFNVSAFASCTNPDNREAKIVAESDNAIIYEGLDSPPNGFTAQQYADIAKTFDTLVVPVDTGAFGKPTDIDNNGKTIILYTRAVNELTSASSASFVGGFFYGRDLFPKSNGITTPSGYPLGPCPGSNVAEMFYMLAPDPTGTVNGNARSTSFVRNITVATIAHEFQHLINSARRLYVNPGATWPETTWMEEGLSHIAEELTFYRASGLTPRQNIDRPLLVSSDKIRNAVNEFQTQNFGRVNWYMKSPSSNAPYQDDDDLETRGAIWAFLRYAADRRGSSDGDTWTRLVNNTQVGISNLQTLFGADILNRFRDWSTANYTDDAVTTGNAAFSQLSWNYRSVLPCLSSNDAGPNCSPPGSFPLKVTNLAANVVNDVDLTDGGAAYFKLGAAASTKASVELSTSASGGLPSQLVVRVIRTK